MSDTVGGSIGGTGGGSSSGLGSLGGIGGTLGLGALGFGLTLGRGESPLPWEYNAVASNAPTMFNQGGTLFNEGQAFLTSGQQALTMANNGQLTAPQQAEVGLAKQNLENTAAQEYAAQGRNANQDTSFINTQANIDAQVNAMAQKEIQTTIQLGLSETQAGGSFSGQGLQYESAANQALIAAGDAQLKNDADYSNSLTSVFGSIATMFGKALPAIIAA